MDITVIFVGHYGGGKGVHIYQDELIHQISTEFEIDENHFFNFYAAPINGKEDTTRSRSFMFFAHAILLASGFNDTISLYIPENGLISLNIPLTNSRLGSSSTRTTHPYYMKLLQRLIYNLNLQIKLKNPYQFCTKGEMISNCKNQVFLRENIFKTMSCSHPDIGRFNQEKSSMHCGVCLPCLIRRSAILSAYGSDGSGYRDAKFTKEKAKKELISFKLGIEHFIKNSNNILLTIQNSGPIDDNLLDYASVYSRGMNELKKLLDNYEKR